jgi:hypothetical protein
LNILLYKRKLSSIDDGALKLAEQKEIKVRDIKPTVIDNVRFVFDNWIPVENRGYIHKRAGGKAEEGNTTDKDGYIQAQKFPAGDGNIKLQPPEGDLDGDVAGGSNSKPLQVLKLRNKKDGGDGPLKRRDSSKKEGVVDLQNMLKALGYYLGQTGQDNVDRDFDSYTEAAVKSFQGAHRDWDGKKLYRDGRVGPKTGDALNRALVGVWYEEYETPRELTKDLKLVSLTEKLTVEKGVNL